MGPLITEGKANVIIGGQWGSEGKGKLAGWLLQEYPQIDIAVSGFMPNAGHTYVDDNGDKIVAKAMPIGAYFPSVRAVLIGPHSVIDVERLQQEIALACDRRKDPTWHPWIHPNACVLRLEDRVFERDNLNAIASTMQGSAAAVMRKMRRNPDDSNLAKDDERLKGMIDDTHARLRQGLWLGHSTALIEVAQGFDLSLNCGLKWPYVSSRDSLIGRAIDNAGVSHKRIGKVIGALRTVPIRVGNTPGGHSGPCYPDQSEVTWEEVSKWTGQVIIERTTVTNRVRRVFGFSWLQLERFLWAVEPDAIFLNFANYLPGDELMDMTARVHRRAKEYGGELALLGMGARNLQMRRVW